MTAWTASGIWYLLKCARDGRLGPLSMPYAYPSNGSVVPAEDLRKWTAEIVRAVGTPKDIATDVALVLVAADLRGVASHGTARLPIYVSLIRSGVMDPRARPRRVGGKLSFVLFDGHNGWGFHAGRVVMDRAIASAKRTGLSASAIRGANHYGIAGWYAMRAARAGMIGISMTNTSPLVAPTRARVPMLGTNPIAFACPAGNFGLVVLDMATSTITWGRVEVAARRREDLPANVALDREGNPTRSPDEVLAGGLLLPLGGLEETAGYKGYGLALMVEILTGALAGANVGPWVQGFTSAAPSNLGQLFLAIDPGVIEPLAEFESRVERLVGAIKAAGAAMEGPDRVLIPGEPEAAREMEQALRGVVMDQEHVASLVALGDDLRTPFPRVQPFVPAPD